MSNKIFNIAPSRGVPRSFFDLSYEKKFTCDMGQLIPILCDEVVPGDKWIIGNEAVVRFQPLVSPVLHEIHMDVLYFFVPDRILWDGWEDFITGGIDGNDTSTLPTWNPSTGKADVGSLWDYLGFPIGMDNPLGVVPVDFPRRAYNRVYNEYFRDETLQTEVVETNEDILWSNYEKDYFTSALLTQQRGDPPSIPVSGTLPLVTNDAIIVQSDITGSPLEFHTDSVVNTAHINSANGVASAQSFFDYILSVDMENATLGIDISDLRLGAQIQRWQELNNIAGARYVEFLRAHFRVSPRDDRLQRPEFIGATRCPVIVSEVLQTDNASLTPLGSMAGHGITVSAGFAGKYHAVEHGLILGIMRVVPKPAYSQGIDRQWLKSTRYDYYFPEFANLSEQEVLQGEIFVTNGNLSENTTLFGYQARYNELRYKRNMICAKMTTDYDYWHLGRVFNLAPVLNSGFISCQDIRKDIFAVPSEPGLIVSFGNQIKAFRPIPFIAQPGYMDH